MDKQPQLHYKVTEAELDDMADKLGSYDLAFGYYGATPDDVEPTEPIAEQETEPELAPIAVELGERAVALENIMAYLNKANQVKGSRAQLENGGGRMTQRYGSNAPEVQRGAERNRDELLAGFRAGIATLAASEALRASGYDNDDVDLEERAVQAAINRRFGVGQTDSGDRAKAVREAKRVLPEA